jgi:bacterioferritin-associated ferredoxin
VIVCVCHRVSDRDIEREVRHGCASFDELQDDLRVGTACGTCTDCARDTFDACAQRHAAAIAGPAQVIHPDTATPSRGARVFTLVPVGATPLAA